MSIPPPPKVNPAAEALDRQRVMGQIGENFIQRAETQKKLDAGTPMPVATHRRDQVVPKGYKRVYAPNQPHQGKKELARRKRQLGMGEGET